MIMSKVSCLILLSFCVNNLVNGLKIIPTKCTKYNSQSTCNSQVDCIWRRIGPWTWCDLLRPAPAATTSIPKPSTSRRPSTAFSSDQRVILCSILDENACRQQNECTWAEDGWGGQCKSGGTLAKNESSVWTDIKHKPCIMYTTPSACVANGCKWIRHGWAFYCSGRGSRGCAEEEGAVRNDWPHLNCDPGCVKRYKGWEQRPYCYCPSHPSGGICAGLSQSQCRVNSQCVIKYVGWEQRPVCANRFLRNGDKETVREKDAVEPEAEEVSEGIEPWLSLIPTECTIIGSERQCKKNPKCEWKKILMWTYCGHKPGTPIVPITRPPAPTLVPISIASKQAEERIDVARDVKATRTTPRSRSTTPKFSRMTRTTMPKTNWGTRSSPRRSTPRRSTPRFTPRRSTPRFTPRRSTPRFTPRRSTPRFTPRSTTRRSTFRARTTTPKLPCSTTRRQMKTTSYCQRFDNHYDCNAHFLCRFNYHAGCERKW